MMKANKAYEVATAIVEQSNDWKYLEERIAYAANHGKVSLFVSFDHNPQTALLMLREFGYRVIPDTIDTTASYYGFTISWFEVTQR